MERRRLMMGAAAALAAPALLRAAPAGAQAPASQAQAPAPLAQPPGFFRTRLGGFTITQLHDGSRTVPLQGFVRNAPIEEVQRTLAESFLPTDALRITFTAPLVETGRHLVLLDTGNGAQPAGSPVGRVAENLRAAGLDPARITHVVISHFHGDHINGLTLADGTAAYPNAEILVPEAEWRFWTDEAAASRAPEAMRPAFANAAARFRPYQGRVRQLGDGAEAVPGIRLSSAFGHTPGHSVIHVADGAEQLMYVADVTNRPELAARRPDFHIMFDMDGAAAEATRRRVFDRIAAERMRVAGFHFPFPAIGHMAKEGDGYRFVPTDWAASA
ncbi:MBL fold metallo-hydrolase [Falsiroseomonas sp. CW058]|uniref:MBL fold metallo-hydrolase n=1 Tax=Falsiroseomonas sp. CW058 TaxID=3388664 RepID=UPI003D31A95F